MNKKHLSLILLGTILNIFLGPAYNAPAEDSPGVVQRITQYYLAGNDAVKHGDNTKAKTYYSMAISLSKSDDALPVAYALDRRALIYNAEKKPDKAVQDLQHAISVTQKVAQDDLSDRTLQTCLQDLAKVYLANNQRQQAKATLERAVHMGAANSNNSRAVKSLYMTDLEMLSSLLLSMKEYKDAQIMLARTVQVSEQLLGSTALPTANILTNLGKAYALDGKYELANTVLRKALAIVVATPGPESLQASVIYGYLGSYVLPGRKQYDDAINYLNQALNIRTKRFGPRSLDVAGNLDALADVYIAEKQPEQAEACLVKSLAIREALPSPEYGSIFADYRKLANLNIEVGNPNKSDEYFKKAIDTAQKFNISPTVFLACLKEAALFYKNNNQPEQAQQLLQQAASLKNSATTSSH